MFISIIIPTQKNNENIGPRLMEIDNYMQKQFGQEFPNKEYEIIVVVDGGSKSSFEIINKMQSLIPNIKVIQRKKNRGTGYSVKEGMLKAKGEYRLYTNMNQAYPINQLKTYINEIQNEKKDIIIGSRYLDKNYPISFLQHSFNRLGNLLIQVLLNKKVQDTQAAFKLFSKKAVDIIFPRVLSNNNGFNIEIMAIARRHHLLTREIPVTIQEESDTSGLKLFGANSYFENLIELFKTKWHLINAHYD